MMKFLVFKESRCLSKSTMLSKKKTLNLKGKDMLICQIKGKKTKKREREKKNMSHKKEKHKKPYLCYTWNKSIFIPLM